MAKAMIHVACLLCLGIASYRLGFINGRHDTIHQLFSGEKDFKQYLTYRKQQMEDRHEG